MVIKKIIPMDKEGSRDKVKIDGSWFKKPINFRET